MSSNAKQTLMNESLTASADGDSFNLPGRGDSHIAFLKAENVNGATTVNAKIQHSPNGVDWFDLASFAALAGVNGSEVVNITAHVLPQLRASVTLVGATQEADALIEIYFRERS
jgi:hypothetical protein